MHNYWFSFSSTSQIRFKEVNSMNNYFLNEEERNYDNDGLDQSEEYFRSKRKSDDEDTYFPPEESEPPHY